jgi:PAS domain S-box-containing protein
MRMRSTRIVALIVGLTTALLVVLAAALVIIQSNATTRQQRLVIQSYESASLVRQLLLVLDDAEAGQRGYLLTGQASYLAPYEQARLEIDSLLRQLEGLRLDDLKAAGQIGSLRVATREKLDELNAAIVAYQLSGSESALTVLRAGIGDAAMERIRGLARAFLEARGLALDRYLMGMRSEQRNAEMTIVAALGAALVCVVASFILVFGGTGRLESVQRDLGRQARLLKTTLETLHDPIVVIDGGGIVVAWNEAFARLIGWNPAEQRVMTRALLLSDQFPKARTLLEPLKLGSVVADRQSTARVSVPGHEYEIFAGVMADGGLVIRCVDITDKLRVEAELRQGQKMEATGQLTGGMAHDFNNILQVVQANLELVRSDVAENSATMGRVKSALAAAQRGGRLIQQLLAFARRQPLTPRATNVARLVNDMADLLRHSLGERVNVEFEVAPDAWSAKIDPGQLENAILNLAINARDAMPEGGTVRIEVANITLDRGYAMLHPEVTPGGYVLIGVSDNGTGMPPDVIARAFDPFFTTKRYGKGTGLGLSMVYGFVRQSGGHVRIDSGIGQGTSVQLYLPRTLEQVSNLAVPASAVSLGSERILVVEDNDDVRQAVVQMLEGLGYRVTSTESPDAALALLEKDSAYDLLFTDVVMPGSLSAMELAAEARRRRPGIAVLLTSGYARGSIPEAADASEGYPLIAKPYGEEDLATKLRTALATAHGAAKASSAEAEQPARAQSMASAQHVLLVEDEVLVRMSTADMLGRLGCIVETAASGEQALKLLADRGPFDLMITDLGLPGMSGEELAAIVRDKFPTLHVVIASGYRRTRGEGTKNTFIAKPYSYVDLEQLLDQILRTEAKN